MPANTIIGWLIKSSVFGKIIRWAGGGLLGLAFLGWIVNHCGPRDCELVLHVGEPDVVVFVDDQSYRIEGRRDPPLVCQLSSGWHRVVLKRGDRVLFEREFDASPGEYVVLTAWEQERGGGPALRPGDRETRDDVGTAGGGRERSPAPIRGARE